MDPILARIYPHLPAWFFYTLVFDPVFDIDFPPSWMDFGPQLGPMLGTFWLYFLSQVEALSWRRFSIDFALIFDYPDTSKSELAPRRESNFQVFILLILSSFWDSILTPQTPPKSSPSWSKIPSDTRSKFWPTSKWILIAIWLQLGPQLGGQKRDLGLIFSNLTQKTADENRGPIFITPFWASRPSGIDFWMIFYIFLTGFWSIFHRSWTLVLILGWVFESINCFNWLV